jgi:hypothetical protein
MDTHIPASPAFNSLTPLVRVRLPFAFFRFSTDFLIDTSTIRNALNPLLCNTDSRSNRQKSKICCTPFANNRRTYTTVSRIPTRNTSRPAFFLTHSKHSHLIFLPETPPCRSALRASSLSRCSGLTSPARGVSSYRFRRFGRAQVTSHELRVTSLLIVNMIIRIPPKPFVFTGASISNRQYPGLLPRRSIRPSAGHGSLADGFLVPASAFEFICVHPCSSVDFNWFVFRPNSISNRQHLGHPADSALRLSRLPKGDRNPL